MKKIACLIILIAAFACKKKNTEPDPEPEPSNPPIEACITKKQVFTGTYLLEGTLSQVAVEFKNNNCPTEYSNTYVVHNIGNAVKPILTSGTVTANDYTVTSDENTGICAPANAEFRLLKQADGSLVLTTSKWGGANNRRLEKI